jgi:hypothetical protein
VAPITPDAQGYFDHERASTPIPEFNARESYAGRWEEQ